MAPAEAVQNMLLATPRGLHDDDALTSVPYVATSDSLASTGCVHCERRDVRLLEYGMSVQAAPVPFCESCLILEIDYERRRALIASVFRAWQSAVADD